MDFFSKLLPSEGFYCVAELLPPAEPGAKRFWRHRWHDNIPDAVTNTLALDAQGKTVFLAQASFSSMQNRTQENAQYLKNFFFDIDCGVGKPYANQAEGAQALKKFVDDTGLPMPTVIKSGNGLYAHWFLEEYVTESVWKGTAGILKKLVMACGFKLDFGLVANSSCVLRPPGTHNRKDPDNPKPVVIVHDTDPIPFELFKNRLEAAAKIHKVETKALKAPKAPGLNAGFLASLEEIPSSAEQIAEECGQIKLMRDKKGDIPEPLWYAAIGLLNFTTEAPEIIHEWSNGYDGYSVEETDRKIEQAKERQTGPTTCYKFGEVNPEHCIGCKYASNLVSPIKLGWDKQEAAVDDQGEIKWAPRKFVRNGTGIWYNGSPEEGGRVHVYLWDIYPIRVGFDSSVGYETMTMHAEDPINGHREFTVDGHAMQDQKAFLIALNKNSVSFVGGNAKKEFMAYMENYIQRLRAEQKLETLLSQMGWRDKDFIWGSQVFKQGHEPESIGLASNVPEWVKAFHSKGDPKEWIEATTLFQSEEMIPYSFAFLAGAFGAPLMKFTGYAGAMVALTGKSGLGKSLILHWIESTYGDPVKLFGLRDDTANTVIARLGVLGSLPFVMDEVSNIDPLDLSNIVYRITQGRDKGRLDRNAREKTNLNYWNTLAVVSSNHSMVEKLSQIKGDAGAEMNRIFEIFLKPTLTLEDREFDTALWHRLAANYGGIGERYLRYIVDHSGEHRQNIEILTNIIDKRTKATAEERFWSTVAAATIYGGQIARTLGLINFDVAPVLDWVCDYIPMMRETKKDNILTPVNTIAHFLDSHVNEILVISKIKSQNGKFISHASTGVRNNIVGRFETDIMRLYISKLELRRFCAQSYTSMRELADALRHTDVKPALVDTDKNKALGAGLEVATGKQKCWEIDMTCPELGYVAATLVKSNKEVEGANIPSSEVQ